MTRTYSAREVLREKDFAEFTADEIYEARALIAELRWDLGKRRTRRWTPGEGPLIDLRRAVRKNMAVGGELVELPRRQRKEKRRPLVLICDVSGSMERYTRILLHFIHTVFGDASRIEAFLFATRLTRVTSYLTDRDVDRAVTEVSHAVPDWAGGTRTGDVLKAFNFQWARRVLGWGGVVLVISDGWDRGEPEVLRSEMARLQRSCHRLVWLNPLLGSPSYEPLSRGMQSALPFVDDFLPVHNLASLEGLAEHLNGLSPRRPGRRQQTWHLERRAAEEPEPQEAPQRSWRMDATQPFAIRVGARARRSSRGRPWRPLGGVCRAAGYVRAGPRQRITHESGPESERLHAEAIHRRKDWVSGVGSSGLRLGRVRRDGAG